jgi:hypothetical protein
MRLSIVQAANYIQVSPATLRRWELEESPMPPSKVQDLISAFRLSEAESACLVGTHVSSIGAAANDKALIRRLHELEGSYRSGDTTNIDIELLGLISSASRHKSESVQSKDTLFRIKTAYVEFLLWSYRRREAFEWASQLPFKFRERPQIQGWPSVVRAHWHLLWERTNDELDVCSFLRKRWAIHQDSPSSIDVATDYAWRLGLTGRPHNGLALLQGATKESPAIKTDKRAAYLSRLYATGLEFMVGNQGHALDQFPCPPKDDVYLRVISSTIRARMLVEKGDRTTAIDLLSRVRSEIADNNLPHFVDVLDRRIQNGGTYLDRW